MGTRKLKVVEEPLGADNLAFVEQQYARFLQSRDAVAEPWRQYFDGLGENGATPRNGGFGPSFEPSSIFNPVQPERPTPRPARTRRPRRLEDGGDLSARLPYVRNLELFRELGEAELVHVAEIAEPVNLEAGQILIREGDHGDAIYVITSGSLRVERSGQTPIFLGPGDVVGELAVLDKMPRSADVFAETPAQVLRISAEDFDDLLRSNGSVAQALFHVVSRRLRDSTVRQERVDHLIRAYRVRGHTIAKLDPLGRQRAHHPELELAFHDLQEADLDLPFSSRTMPGTGRMTLRQIITRLKKTYCGSIGIQYMHIDDPEVKDWLQRRMEDSENRRHLSVDEQQRIFTRLTDAEVFEQFLHKKFIGAKRFSLEGGESLIPLLDMAIEEASGHGVTELVFGMAHRGRLNVLANILRKKASRIFEEFEDKDPDKQEGGGDVKYHMGFSSDVKTSAGHDMHLTLCFNPSHLEFVGPVLAGRVRAKQDRIGDYDRRRVMGVLIHGDGAIAGQGVVQELFNMSELPGYTTGGTLHVVVNNQIGFTTPPERARSTQYATDVARMLDIPIFHVNGEDPEAVAQVIQLAMDFRERFRRDVVIDMYCYRRHGHNEGDEPTFTQPVMYQWIRKRQSVREGYLENLVKLGGITPSQAAQIAEASRKRLEAELDRARAGESEDPVTPEYLGGLWQRYAGGDDRAVPEVATGLTPDDAAEFLRASARLIPNFRANPKTKRLLKLREEMAAGERPLDWGAAEACAYASLLAAGHRVRLSGQDAGRGTFSHRHAILYDKDDGHAYVPLLRVRPEQAPFEVWDSPLSETGVLGFDYGYSLDCPDGLVLWEAQFGDFANGAQVIIDQFITSSEDKWRRLTGLVMLLPHGFEGQGPEHSSARLERFLQLAAEDNIYVMNLTTPAQYFHALRRQMLRAIRKPLVVMTPKSLLRHPEAVSALHELSDGSFRKVLWDHTVPADKARTVLLCSGKIYYELRAERAERGIDDVAILRIEQLYPLPDEELREALAPYGDDVPVWWVQEEPANMGAWSFLRWRLGSRLFGRQPLVDTIARAESASPATGSAASHRKEQARLIDQALTARA